MLKAMSFEIESMYSNQVWELVKPADVIYPIWCKWIYKMKICVDEKVETFKAILVTKLFTKKEGIECEKAFSPIDILKSICILSN